MNHQGRKSRFSEEFKRLLASKYESGLSIPKIAKEFGLPNGTVWHLVSKKTSIRPWTQSGSGNNLHRGGGLVLGDRNVGNRRAMRMIGDHVRAGNITPPTSCQECGASGVYKDGRRKVQAHHCSYNKPLDVMWLCQKCHTAWHQNNKAIPRFWVVDVKFKKDTLGWG